MGEKYEVLEWTKYGEEDGINLYRDEQRYFGPSLLKAFIKMWKLKQAGAGCVRLVWR